MTHPLALITEPRDQGLVVEIVNGVLSITIGVDTLCHAVKMGMESQFYGGEGEITFTNPDVFAQAVMNALTYEEEDGATPLHAVFDAAAIEACEQGCEGIEFEEDKVHD